MKIILRKFMTKKKNKRNTSKTDSIIDNKINNLFN